MIFFISDLHLSPRSPGATRLFLRFLAGRARQAEALYILGDLFEVWVGDDINDPYAAQITAALREASQAGLKICFMHGNRDFAIGEQFATAAGISLLPDPYELVLPEWSFVLAHGDALCLDDHAYMTYRAKVRDPEWQRKMRAKPRFLRSLLGRYIRWRSARRKRDQAYVYADLNGPATDDFLREHGYATFIHGHTHRPEKHDHIVDGIHVERWVLADWHETHGEALRWDGEALSREAVTLES
ncbi:UDP-2,3-diacylglucosamine diphosphatase [Dechloromonas sp. HYN0024]|uniref:UDP-2,3-diacylglucosamine diphosphatase n=1 Tax=Dechloromonas sp. HYN0024 TaxID=2231055 RepID=UPI000E43293C|nr:UDP-2,3-diacylglucosamine diphosphatase [Dechloromonas sp. HYN0024]AXS80567.1 UDP-2,3-diacylglucosamine diphosphatase [Dechloromonas sp. HYN0024]